MILVMALLYALRGYTRAWIGDEPVEVRWADARLLFAAGVVIWTVIFIGYLIYDYYKGE